MAALWAWHLHLRNAGIVDGGWAGLVGALAVFYALCAADGTIVRRTAIALMTGIWSVRLATMLLTDRVFGRPEDGRYADLRRRKGAAASRWFFWFFQMQAAAAILFSVPALLAVKNTAQEVSPVEYAGIAAWAVGFCGAWIADSQLQRFKRSPASRGRTCRVGLWRYSRHPNYFFEWITWIGYALFASAAPLGWIAFVCPLILLVLLFKVTGIPATEAQAIRTRGDDYRRYQQTTSAFVPWFPKR